jgi:RNA polymerase sigma-70 factor (ECF subfamily)
VRQDGKARFLSDLIALDAGKTGHHHCIWNHAGDLALCQGEAACHSLLLTSGGGNSPMARHLAAAHESSVPPDLADQFVDSIPNLRGFARGLTRNPSWAEDLVQDTLVRGWASHNQFVPGTNFRAWMFTIMRNRFYDECRRNKTPTLAIEEATYDAALISGPAQDSAIEFEEMASAYWQLAPNHREVLMLVGALGFEYEDAAKVIGCATGTIRSRLSRARTELQKHIERGVGRVSRASGRQTPSHPTAGEALLRQIQSV